MLFRSIYGGPGNCAWLSEKELTIVSILGRGGPEEPRDYNADGRENVADLIYYQMHED